MSNYTSYGIGFNQAPLLSPQSLQLQYNGAVGTAMNAYQVKIDNAVFGNGGMVFASATAAMGGFYPVEPDYGHGFSDYE